MPRCLNCGNDATFASSSIPSGSPWAGGEAYGLYASFTEGQVNHVENGGASYETAQQAVNRPEAFFDTCHQCGSTNIIWP